MILAAALLAAACPPHQHILDETARLIARDYVIASEASDIAREVRGWARSGRYRDSCDDLASFAERLERDLKRRDQHFNIVIPGADASEAGGLAEWRAEAFAANVGVRDVAVLDGNIGYLRLSSFYSWDLAEPKLAQALALLKDSRGLILDLRRNGGGDGETADHLLAALLPAGSTLIGWEEKRSGRSEVRLPEHTSLPRYPSERPLVILVDRRSGSASEAVAYHLQARKRALVVGDRTSGSAHLYGEELELPHGLRITIPEARPIVAANGGNWEGRGVQPDVSGGDDPLYAARRKLEELLAPSRSKGVAP